MGCRADDAHCPALPKQGTLQAHPGVRRWGRLQRMEEFSGFTRTRSPSWNLQGQQW